MPRVSIIIPHYNGTDILRQCLSSIYEGAYDDFEVLVVDNASTDGSPEMVESEFPLARTLRLSENHGFAGGCNEGIRNSDSEFVCILNNDTVQEKDWLIHLVNYLDSHSETASVMPLINSWHAPDTFDYSGGSGGFLDIYGYPFVRGRIFEVLEKDEGQYNDSREVFWCSGTAFLVRRSVLNATGLFDERFFAHMEEIDLHWRIHLAGRHAAVVPDSRILHMSGWTLPPDRYMKKYLNHRNNLIMLMANYSLKSLVRLLPVRIIMEYISAAYALVKGDFKRFAAVFASQFYILFHLPYIISKHRRHQALRKISDNALKDRMYNRSLVISHFIRKIRRFSDLQY